MKMYQSFLISLYNYFIQKSPKVIPTVLKLIYFSKKPIIEFGRVEVGNEKTRELVVSNVNDYDTNVVVERVPEKKGFRVLCVSLYFL